MEHPLPERAHVHPAIGAPFDQPSEVDMAFGGATRPCEGESRFDRTILTLNGIHQPAHLWEIAATTRTQPDIHVLAPPLAHLLPKFSGQVVELRQAWMLARFRRGAVLYVF